jgi:hypothetical protein
MVNDRTSDKEVFNRTIQKPQGLDPAKHKNSAERYIKQT